MPPNLAARVGGLAGTAALLAAPVLPATPIVSAAPLASVASVVGAPPPLTVEYTGTVYGDFAMTGNTVTTCPRRPGRYPVRLCRAAQNQVGTGPAAQNNGHPMAWTDIDHATDTDNDNDIDDTATYNSSSGRLIVPPGSRIVHAALSWAGNTGGPASTPCGRGTVRPAGTPRQQPVSVTVNGATSRIRPDRYTEDTQDTGAAIGPTDQVFYSARADLTAELRGVRGAATITVGNIWTPQGYDCFGGWSLLAVWVFDSPQAPFALARKQITVYDGHLRLLTGTVGKHAWARSIRPAGGRTRIGVGAYEGDWAMSGDRVFVNGHDVTGYDVNGPDVTGYDPDRTGNFFVSFAEGSLDPHHPNNMSVDVRTFEVPAEVIKAGDRAARFTLSSGVDAYLVSTLALSTPMPELSAATTVHPATVHPGDTVDQTVQVTNVGGAPAVNIRVRTDLAPTCERTIARLDAGQTATITCTGTAPETDRPLSARVNGRNLIGDPLTARADTTIAVLHPAIAAHKTAHPATVLHGQTVRYEISVHNTGNTPLSRVAFDDQQVDACDSTNTSTDAGTMAGTLAAGQSMTVRCQVVAGDQGYPNTVTASGTDTLGKQVTARATATFAVVHPKVTIAVSPSTHAVRPGSSVTFTITVANPSTIPLGAVTVDGTPGSCTRFLGTLGTGQTVRYTCTATIHERWTTALSVRATPVLDGQPVADRRDTVRDTASTIVSVIPAVPPPLPPPPPPASPGPAVQNAGGSPPVSPAPVAVLVAGLAVLSSFVTVGAIAATASRPGR